MRACAHTCACVRVRACVLCIVPSRMVKCCTYAQSCLHYVPQRLSEQVSLADLASGKAASALAAAARGGGAGATGGSVGALEGGERISDDGRGRADESAAVSSVQLTEAKVGPRHRVHSCRWWRDGRQTSAAGRARALGCRIECDGSRRLVVDAAADGDRPTRLCSAATSAPGLGLTPATSAPELGLCSAAGWRCRR
jgi:hypothetical protein